MLGHPLPIVVRAEHVVEDVVSLEGVRRAPKSNGRMPSVASLYCSRMKVPVLVAVKARRPVSQLWMVCGSTCREQASSSCVIATDSLASFRTYPLTLIFAGYVWRLLSKTRRPPPWPERCRWFK